MMYITNNNNQINPFSRFKLLVEKFRHCKFELTNQDLVIVPKVFNKLIDIFIKFWVPVQFL